MKPCKSHQRQIALLAADALSESERPAVLEHLQVCPACRSYAEQLQAVVGLYTEDAERPVAPARAAVRRFAAERIPWYQKVLASPTPALAAAAVIVACGTLLLIQRKPDHGIAFPPRTAATVKEELPAVPSIGNSRQMTSAELEDLSRPEPAKHSGTTEFVFSVKTRDDGS